MSQANPARNSVDPHLLYTGKRGQFRGDGSLTVRAGHPVHPQLKSRHYIPHRSQTNHPLTLQHVVCVRRTQPLVYLLRVVEIVRRGIGRRPDHAVGLHPGLLVPCWLLGLPHPARSRSARPSSRACPAYRHGRGYGRNGLAVVGDGASCPADSVLHDGGSVVRRVADASIGADGPTLGDGWAWSRASAGARGDDASHGVDGRCDDPGWAKLLGLGAWPFGANRMGRLIRCDRDGRASGRRSDSSGRVFGMYSRHSSNPAGAHRQCCFWSRDESRHVCHVLAHARLTGYTECHLAGPPLGGHNEKESRTNEPT